MQIAQKMLETQSLALDMGAKRVLEREFSNLARNSDQHSGNWRMVRNRLESATRRQALRLAKCPGSPSKRNEQLKLLTAEDFLETGSAAPSEVDVPMLSMPPKR